MFDDGCTSLVFLRSTMVVYPCDKHKVFRLLTGKKGQLKKEVTSVAKMTNFGFGPKIIVVQVNHPLQVLIIEWFIMICKQDTCTK